MWAIQITRTEGREVLTAGDLPDPHPNRGKGLHRRTPVDPATPRRWPFSPAAPPARFILRL
jgi:hypothetical protein